MINITLPDGSIKKVESGTSAMDIAMEISEGLARNVLSATINNEVWDANRPITTDSTLTLHTWNDKHGVVGALPTLGYAYNDKSRIKLIP